jgi:hypothetical protein
MYKENPPNFPKQAFGRKKDRFFQSKKKRIIFIPEIEL